MDDAIVPHATMRQRGADAFDRGLGIDDHNMNPWSAAVADWRAGYIERRAERRAQHAQASVEMVLALAIAMECPP